MGQQKDGAELSPRITRERVAEVVARIGEHRDLARSELEALARLDDSAQLGGSPYRPDPVAPSHAAKVLRESVRLHAWIRYRRDEGVRAHEVITAAIDPSERFLDELRDGYAAAAELISLLLDLDAVADQAQAHLDRIGLRLSRAARAAPVSDVSEDSGAWPPDLGAEETVRLRSDYVELFDAIAARARRHAKSALALVTVIAVVLVHDFSFPTEALARRLERACDSPAIRAAAATFCPAPPIAKDAASCMYVEPQYGAHLKIDPHFCRDAEWRHFM